MRHRGARRAAARGGGLGTGGAVRRSPGWILLHQLSPLREDGRSRHRRRDGRQSRHAPRFRVQSRHLAGGSRAPSRRCRRQGDPPDAHMTLALYRIDDRLINGQVVVGGGQPLDVSFIVLVDDEVSSSDWEQDLYRMGVPPQIEVIFASVEKAAELMPGWEAESRVGILLVGDIDTAVALAARVPQLKRFNVGGVHHRTGRKERLRFVYLTDDEAAKLRQLADRGVDVTAQDVPTARAVPVAEFT